MLYFLWKINEIVVKDVTVDFFCIALDFHRTRETQTRQQNTPIAHRNSCMGRLFSGRASTPTIGEKVPNPSYSQVGLFRCSKENALIQMRAVVYKCPIVTDFIHDQ